MSVINRYNGLYWLLCHPGYCHYLSVQEPHNQKEETKSYAAEWGFPPNPRTSPRNPATGNQCHVHNPCICYQQQGNVANVKECKTFPNHLNQILKKIKSPFILLSVCSLFFFRSWKDLTQRHRNRSLDRQNISWWLIYWRGFNTKRFVL